MSIVESAKSELELAGWSERESRVMLDILRRFFDEWDSGGAVAVASAVLRRLIAGQPLAPLTGKDDEFIEVGPGVFQNRRCSSVFKEGGRAYDIDVAGRPTITFPYDPVTKNVEMPIYDIETED